MKTTILSNKMQVPLLGLGANGIWGEKAKHSDLAKNQYDIYTYALKAGCRLFDTSAAYGYNEEILGEALAAVGNRKEVLLMTKISNPAQRKYRVRQDLENSLRRLQVDQLDILLLHWPQTGTFVDAWLELEKLYNEKLVRAIGVCNCNKHHIEEILHRAHIVPMINEFEVHPLFTQDALINYCRYHDIQVVAYTPVGRMHDVLIKAKPIRELAAKYLKTPVQIILRWHWQFGRVAIPRTVNPAHFDEFMDVQNFALTEKELCWISSLNDNIRLRYDPDSCDFNIL